MTWQDGTEYKMNRPYRTDARQPIHFEVER